MAVQQIVAVAALIFGNILTQHEVRVEIKRRWEAAPNKPNVSMRLGPTKTELKDPSERPRDNNQSLKVGPTPKQSHHH